MNVRHLFALFIKDEMAAVTVDWVVLTAGIVFLGLTVVTLVSSGLDASATSIANGITVAVSSALS